MVVSGSALSRIKKSLHLLLSLPKHIHHLGEVAACINAATLAVIDAGIPMKVGRVTLVVSHPILF